MNDKKAENDKRRARRAVVNILQTLLGLTPSQGVRLVTEAQALDWGVKRGLVWKDDDVAPGGATFGGIRRLLASQEQKVRGERQLCERAARSLREKWCKK